MISAGWKFPCIAPVSYLWLYFSLSALWWWSTTVEIWPLRTAVTPPPLTTVAGESHLFFHPLPKQSHNIQVNMTAEAQQPFHTANVQSRPKRPDESNLIPQISLSLSLDYKPHESTAKINWASLFCDAKQRSGTKKEKKTKKKMMQFKVKPFGLYTMLYVIK